VKPHASLACFLGPQAVSSLLPFLGDNVHNFHPIDFQTRLLIAEDPGSIVFGQVGAIYFVAKHVGRVTCMTEGKGAKAACVVAKDGLFRWHQH
jgi:hypothetical protein